MLTNDRKQRILEKFAYTDDKTQTTSLMQALKKEKGIKTRAPDVSKSEQKAIARALVRGFSIEDRRVRALGKKPTGGGLSGRSGRRKTTAEIQKALKRWPQKVQDVIASSMRKIKAQQEPTSVTSGGKKTTGEGIGGYSDPYTRTSQPVTQSVRARLLANKMENLAKREMKKAKAKAERPKTKVTKIQGSGW